MRITSIRECSVSLQGNIANAVVDFSSHTVSLVALISNQIRNGKPVVGVAFNSIGRFSQSGILQDRLIPRVMAANPASLLATDGTRFDPSAVASTAMTNEKPGGHGDRASAVAALELAVWDLNAKLADEPAYENIARIARTSRLGRGTPVYAAGGYYYPSDSTARLRDELLGYLDQGYEDVKIKIGGAGITQDLKRIETAIELTGDATRVAVDANGRFTRAAALDYSEALAPLGLRWFEEPCDPLDYALLAELAAAYSPPLATGENLFSAIDNKNLTRYGGLRPDKDVLQLDPGLSYGLTEYLRVISNAEAAGFDRLRCIPHGGHLINLHIVTALGLGSCEAYPGVFQPFGGYSPQCRVEQGRIWPSDAPGFGLEQKPELAPLIAKLVEN